MIIAIVYDNYGHKPAIRKGSGFSCLAKVADQTVLFDTGAHSSTLLYNIEKLGFAPKEIKAIVLSHIDSDYVGGLFGLLERNWKTKPFQRRHGTEAIPGGI